MRLRVPAQRLQLRALAAEGLDQALQAAGDRRDDLLGAVEPVGGLFEKLQVLREDFGPRLEGGPVHQHEILGRGALRAGQALAFDVGAP